MGTGYPTDSKWSTISSKDGMLRLGTGGSSNPTNIICSGSNVGIGDTTPSYKLDVNGTGRFTGKLDIDSGLDVNSGDIDIFGGGNIKFYRSGNSAYGRFLIDTGEKIALYSSYNSKTVMVWDRDGNVGIGNTAPSEVLTVTGDISASGDFHGLSGTLTLGGNISGSSTSTGSFGKISVGCAGQTSTVKLAVAGDVFIGTGAQTLAAQNTLHVQGTGITLSEGDRNRASIHSTYSNTTDGALVIKARGGSTPVEIMRISGSGNVGIGTTSPSVPLHVYEDAASYAALIQQNQGNGLALDVLASSSDDNTNDLVRFRTDAATLMVVQNDGKVGIGTTSPGALLHVSSGT